MSAEEYQQALEAMQAMGLGGPVGQSAQPGQPASTPDPDKGFLSFEQGSMQLDVWITRGETSTRVLLALRDSQE
jgi:hypothetical protein